MVQQWSVFLPDQSGIAPRPKAAGNQLGAAGSAESLFSLIGHVVASVSDRIAKRRVTPIILQACEMNGVPSLAHPKGYLTFTSPDLLVSTKSILFSPDLTSTLSPDFSRSP